MMIPSFLITFREVIEASLIVATILGILTKLGYHKSIKTVWFATGTAALVSIGLLLLGSVIGLKVQELYESKEALFEGILMMLSAVFITWAVFWLHTYFAKHKMKLLQKVKQTIEKSQQRGLFALVFTAVFREGFEIVLFLSTVYLSSNPQQVLGGFSAGVIGGLLISAGLFSATLKIPVFYAFRTTSALLILFAAGLLGRGIHEFIELGLLPEATKVTFAFIPHATTLTGGIIKAVFGITNSMDLLQTIFYLIYVVYMIYWIFLRKSPEKITVGE